ncbi:MAG: hypothetical protein U9N81_13885 [Bacillota bacterium]|nr:hypothetical protein [Bacillota bacterium]
MAESAQQALGILRDTSYFQWYIIPLLMTVIYVVSVEIERENWNVLLGGLAFWGMDWFNEIWNSLVFHFTQYAPVWGAPSGHTAYLILIGLNIEITFMFLIAGIACAKMLPKDKHMKILGIPNRWFLGTINCILFVIVEIILNSIGVLTWEYSWWQAGFPFVLFIIGYAPFLAACYWVHDMDNVKKQLTSVAIIFGVNISALIVFGAILNWI